ncbi:transcription factor TFIIB repeat protein (macronuclear) [Tetrahymena thermophila SB210]|uniref:Transcription factor TFIIB repeat protein n=1 Tax=Tetrahymena thermophila (strain SB210) TaxID=312017 RepID=I7MGV8_TETTS|nr:transcription factor TFIIB repeat protein [Tetrahymena thermophila SB210]EAR85509.1 transcription factor TFIIB repeat protein [Tetrahymena thermophila SB210]|eukprot:XP_001033172.1 transcription factor TFIIB repeat protein [Tetrahymena thermophila SB210]
MIDTIDYKSNKQVCKKCGHVNYDLDGDEADQQKCRNCGFVMYENCFESGIQFTDTKIDGQLHDMSNFGRDNTKYAEECIATMIRDLKIKSEYPDYLERIGETPLRIMKFAYKAYFLDHGSNIHHYSAAALYIALRFQKAPFLLMDFSEKLCINLFKLARCYRKLAKFLNVTLKLNERLPSIDPSIYIPRFCKMLEFNDKVDQVKETAIKLLKRMKLDWMSHGRRPSSLCGAAILIAARMHGFKRTTSEVCKVVYVCEETLRKRLEEFKETDVAKLTREKFDEIQDIELMGRERDPPAFIKALKNQQETLKKIKPNEENDDEINKQLEDAANIIETQVKSTSNEGQQVNQDYEMSDDISIGDDEEDEGENSKQQNGEEQKKQLKPLSESERQVKTLVKKEDAKQIGIINENGYSLNVREDLSDMSEEDVNQFILTNEEHTVKSIIWHSMNETWLREQQRKDPKEEKKECKKRNKRRNDQLMNEDDPVDALFKSKKIREKLDEKKVRDMFLQIEKVKMTQLTDIFTTDKPPAESLETTQKMIYNSELIVCNGPIDYMNRYGASNDQSTRDAPQIDHDEDGFEYD